ncbi:MAG: coproporphyrinogen III oxidase family protein [Woeseiaceae bacterium]|nr:coproporphyrinogen III oxidase family protein [Woeseiaceae bacterium]
MNIEELLGSFVRRLNRRDMHLSPSTLDSSLPAPAPGLKYLLYLHVPYCIALCPFCSFHRVKFERDSATRYFDCLRREISLVTDAGYSFDELYVGGGTPTVLPDELVATIAAVRARHAVDDISVETNPDHLRADALQELKQAGVTRLSVGVQSFDDNLLKAMRRFDNYGSGPQIAARLKEVRGIIDTVNVDMIFNLPQQTESSLRHDLDVLVDDVAADQVSFYPLMTSDSTRAEMSRTMGTSSLSRQKDYYQLITERMLSAGYLRSSAWCFSRKPGMYDEYIVDREQYVGLGSGAFSFLKGALFANTFSIGGYMELLEAGKSSVASKRAMSAHDQKRYYLLMRLFGGTLDKECAEERFNGEFQHGLWAELTALKAIDAVRDTGKSLVLTERGYYLWVVLMREFFSETNTLRDQMRHDIDRPSSVRNSEESTNVRA